MQTLDMMYADAVDLDHATRLAEQELERLKKAAKKAWQRYDDARDRV